MEHPTVCISGGAIGADEHWAQAAIYAGLTVHIMSFEGHSAKIPFGSSINILDSTLLATADKPMEAAGLTIKRSLPVRGTYTSNLLRRNWFIVKDADAVFAIGTISKFSKITGTGTGTVGSDSKNINLAGGTGWGCQMFFDLKTKGSFMYPKRFKVPLFVYDMYLNRWYQSMSDATWEECDMPDIYNYKTVGLVGSREISPGGTTAIRKVFEIFHQNKKGFN